MAKGLLVLTAGKMANHTVIREGKERGQSYNHEENKSFIFMTINYAAFTLVTESSKAVL